MHRRELEVKLAAAAADLDAQRDYSAQLADRCQVQLSVEIRTLR